MSFLKDDSEMPYGKHAGTKMANVPASYLIWCYENRKIHPDVAVYVSQNMDVLRKQMKEEQEERRRWRDCDASEIDIY